VTGAVPGKVEQMLKRHSSVPVQKIMAGPIWPRVTILPVTQRACRRAAAWADQRRYATQTVAGQAF